MALGKQRTTVRPECVLRQTETTPSSMHCSLSAQCSLVWPSTRQIVPLLTPCQREDLSVRGGCTVCCVLGHNREHCPDNKQRAWPLLEAESEAHAADERVASCCFSTAAVM